MKVAIYSTLPQAHSCAQPHYGYEFFFGRANRVRPARENRWYYRHWKNWKSSGQDYVRFRLQVIGL